MSHVVKKNPQGKFVVKVKKGALHKALGVDKDSKLTAKEEAIKPGDSKLMQKRKVFAQNAAKWKK